MRFFIILFLLAQSLQAQKEWVLTGEPKDVRALAVSVSGSNLFAGTKGGGVWKL